MRRSHSRESAGLLMYRIVHDRVEVLLAHPGGPYFRGRDDGAWTIPKGEIEPGEDPRAAAVREFEEEIGRRPVGPFLDLGAVRQRGGKTVHAWAFRGDRDDDAPLGGSTFRLEWPPRSGRVQTFPEIDAARFFDLVEARPHLNPAQVILLERLQDALSRDIRSPT